MIGLLYKAYPDGCQQVLLRLRSYLARRHQLLYDAKCPPIHCLGAPVAVIVSNSMAACNV